ncbi:MAG TPA: spermidine synthase [Elusimicrobia bacterium]|jgi:spermidine synthase|nr:spermidine synthase [Elusimicrobiota bacterium]
MKKNSHWLTEWFTPDEKHSHQIKKYLVSEKTDYQKMVLADTYSFGRCLILDGEMQSAEFDEFIYHEALVHPALSIHPNPKKILIMGGGEGATLREVLKHKTVEKAIMVDIDDKVIEFSKKYLKKWHRRTFFHPKTELLIVDAKKYVEETKNRFDCIIADLPSPIKEGPAYQLYTLEFYQILKRKLNPQGIFVTQAGSGNLIQIELHRRLYATLKKVFHCVYPYYQFIPSFDVPWAFLLCRDEKMSEYSSKEIDQRIQERIQNKLKFYDGITHRGLFYLPKNIRKLLTQEKEIITIKKPCFFYK